MTPTITRTVKYGYDPAPLKSAMRSQEVTQRSLAVDLSVHHVTICRALSGKSASEDLLRKICERLRVPLDLIFTGPRP